MSSKFHLRLPLLSLLVILSTTLYAHEYKGMSTQIEISDTSATIALHIAAADVMLLAARVDRDRNARMSRDEFDLGRTMLEQGVPLMLKFTSDNIPVVPQSTRSEVTSTEGFTNEPHTLTFTSTYAAPTGTFGRVRIDPNLYRSFKTSPVDGTEVIGTQRNTVTILDRGARATLQATGNETYDSGQKALAASGIDTSQTVAGINDGTTQPATSDTAPALNAEASASAGMSLDALLWNFFVEGIRHILIGWDHIFFVVGIILIAQNLRALIKVITAFTIAHSITLILASLDILRISKPQIVEAIIAASVAYVGLENIIFNNKPVPWRWGLVFAFGLIHGLGFAGVLAELLGEGHATGGSRGQIVGCLLTFNVGVEVGQLMVVCLLWPLLQLLRRQKPVAAKYTVIAASALILIMGVSFLLDRTFLPGRLPWVEMFNG